MANPIAKLHWRGDAKIQLIPNDVKGSSLENRILAISFLNRAFELFYECRRGIALCGDTRMQEIMTKELEAAATNGSHKGECDDLKEAIEHATAQKSNHKFSAPYQWRDNKLQSYQCSRFHQKMAFDTFGGRYPTIWQEGDVISAKAAVRFMCEMDDRVSVLQSIFGNIERKWRFVHRTGLRLHRSGSKPADNEWKALGNHLKSLTFSAKESQRYMWLSSGQLEERFNKLTSSLGSSTTVLGVALRIDALADRMVKGSASLTSLKEALELLCVLGTFFARAFDLIPHAKTWINHMNSRRWNEVRLLSGEAKGARLAELESSAGVLGGGSGLRAFPFLGSYRDARNSGVL